MPHYYVYKQIFRNFVPKYNRTLTFKVILEYVRSKKD